MKQIDVSDERGLEVWARTFHIKPEQLVQLVRDLGPSAEQIREALKRAEIGRSAGRHL